MDRVRWRCCGVNRCLDLCSSDPTPVLAIVCCNLAPGTSCDRMVILSLQGASMSVN
jgi:hypothetical protein